MAQAESRRRKNSVRTLEMRARLVSAARALFVEQGFAATGTPQIVGRAEVTRGALYHHFTDKTDLFDAVVVAEAEALGAEISRTSQGLQDGARNFFRAMAVPGRARLLLLEGPAVLGRVRMDEVDAGGGRRSLVEGLRVAMPDATKAEQEALAVVLSAAFDRAALAIADGAKPAPYTKALARLMTVMHDA